MQRKILLAIGFALLVGFFIALPGSNSLAVSTADLKALLTNDDPSVRSAASDVISQRWLTNPPSTDELFSLNGLDPLGTPEGRRTGLDAQVEAMFTVGDPLIGVPVTEDPQAYADSISDPNITLERAWARARAVLIAIRSGFAIVPGGAGEAFNRIQTCLNGSIQTNEENLVLGVALDCSQEPMRRALADTIAKGFYLQFGSLPAVSFDCTAMHEQAVNGSTVEARWAAAQAYVEGCGPDLVEIAQSGGSVELQQAAVHLLAPLLAEANPIDPNAPVAKISHGGGILNAPPGADGFEVSTAPPARISVAGIDSDAPAAADGATMDITGRDLQYAWTDVNGAQLGSAKSASLARIFSVGSAQAPGNITKGTNGVTIVPLDTTGTTPTAYDIQWSWVDAGGNSVGQVHDEFIVFQMQVTVNPDGNLQLSIADHRDKTTLVPRGPAPQGATGLRFELRNQGTAGPVKNPQPVELTWSDGSTATINAVSFDLVTVHSTLQISTLANGKQQLTILESAPSNQQIQETAPAGATGLSFQVQGVTTPLPIAFVWTSGGQPVGATQQAQGTALDFELVPSTIQWIKDGNVVGDPQTLMSLSSISVSVLPSGSGAFQLLAQGSKFRASQSETIQAPAGANGVQIDALNASVTWTSGGSPLGSAQPVQAPLHVTLSDGAQLLFDAVNPDNSRALQQAIAWAVSLQLEAGLRGASTCEPPTLKRLAGQASLATIAPLARFYDDCSTSPIKLTIARQVSGAELPLWSFVQTQ